MKLSEKIQNYIDHHKKLETWGYKTIEKDLGVWVKEAENLEEKMDDGWLCVNCLEEVKIPGQDLCEDCKSEVGDEPYGKEYEHPNDGDSDE